MTFAAKFMRQKFLFALCHFCNVLRFTNYFVTMDLPNAACDENVWSSRGKTWNKLECFRGYLIPGIFGGFPEDTFELTRFIPSSWLAKLFNSFLWSFQLTRIPSISRPLLSLSHLTWSLALPLFLFLTIANSILGVETLTFCRRFSMLAQWDIHWKVSI